MTVTDPVREGPADERTALDALGADGYLRWRDELVTLLVLAGHGDETAGSRVGRWTTIDPVARALCTTMARDLALLRVATP